MDVSTPEHDVKEPFDAVGRKKKINAVTKLSDSKNTLTLLLFAKKSYKNLTVNAQKVNWFDYGAAYKDYQNNCFGVKIHSTARFFNLKTGEVFIPKDADGLLIKVCSSRDDSYSSQQGQVIQTSISRCDYLTNPLCRNLVFHIPAALMKKSRQPPWEFSDVLETRGIALVHIETPEQAKEIYEKYFSS